MKRITVELLESLNTCEDQVATFKQVFPKGAPVSMRSLNKAMKAGLNVFFLERLLSDQALAEYKKIRGRALDEYKKIEGLARAEYEKIEGPAWDEYEKIEGRARAEYEKIEGRAWDEYEKIAGRALDEYKEIEGPALVRALLLEGKDGE